MLPVACRFVVPAQMTAMRAYQKLVMMIARIVPLGMAVLGSLKNLNCKIYINRIIFYNFNRSIINGKIAQFRTFKSPDTLAPAKIPIPAGK